jgi:hypothetical protein
VPGVCVDTGGGLPPDITGGHLIDPLKNKHLTLIEFIKLVLTTMVQWLVPLIVIFYIITGLMFIFARGAPEKLKTARTALLYVTIGAAVVLGAWAFAESINTTVQAL